MNPSAANVTNREHSAPSGRSMPLIGTTSITFAAAVALMASLTGCSSSSDGNASAGDPTEVQAVTFRATDQFRFEPATATVHTGKVRITLTDAGSYPHNISFPGLHQTSASVSGSPGQTSATLDLTVNTPGHYSFVCTYHSSAGMKGELVVLKRP